jgi:cell division protease FtsH
MAASNRPEILDPALVRPGRFDRTIVLGLPDREGRRAILDVHANGKRLAADVDLDAAASVTRGMSGADLANVMNEAALLAARRRLKEIPMSLVDEAIERVELGLSRGHVLSEEERRRVAYHEAGHGLVAAELGGTVPHKLTIVPRGQDVGAMWQVDEERVIHSRPAMIDLMATLLAGRAAEEMVLGEPGSGAADDLARVGRIARQMVRELGMSDALGALTYGDGNGGAPYSQETAQLIDAETRRLVAEAEGRAEQILQRSAPALHRVANALLERETLTSKEFEQLVRSAGTRQPERATRLA